MVPFSSFAAGRWTFGPPRLARFNSFPSINIWGEPAPGRSSGEAMQAMEEAVEKLPKGFGFDWTGLSYQERMSSRQAPLLYAFSVLVIFLVLAALYESWTVPISIVLALPLGVLGGILATSMRGLVNDVYFQIGLLCVLGLTTKNAILIVQFAKNYLEQGMGVIDATLLAARRLRPIVMTSLAFILGVVPLLITSGAGAEMRRTLGLAVFSGMLGVTLFGIFLTPVFFNVIDWLGATRGFDSAPMRWLRFITLEIFALGFLLTLVRLLWDGACRAWRRANSPPIAPHR